MGFLTPPDMKLAISQPPRVPRGSKFFLGFFTSECGDRPSFRANKIDPNHVKTRGASSRCCNAWQHFQNAETRVRSENRSRKGGFLSGWPILPRPKGFLYIETPEKQNRKNVFGRIAPCNCTMQVSSPQANM